MANLFTLSADAAILNEAISEANPDELDGLLTLKAENKEDFAKKVLNYGKLILAIQAEVNAIKDEINRLEVRMTVRQNHIESLKNALNFGLEQAGEKKIEDEFITVSRRAKPTYLEVMEEEKIPETFRRKKISFDAGVIDINTIWDLQATYGSKMQIKDEIAKTEINKWFKKTGEIVAGTVVRENEFTLQVK